MHSLSWPYGPAWYANASFFNLLEIEMTTTQEKQFFNLHVSGIGYLNRVRWVTPKSGGRRAEPFLACSIAALRGSSDDPAYTYFDLRVSGEEAMEIVDKLAEDVAQQRKVILSFRAGDIYPHLYERDVREQGRPTGQKEMATLIKGRLLLINTVKVDGELVYTREQEEPTGEGEVEQKGDDAGYASDALQQPESQRSPAIPAEEPVAQEQGRAAQGKPRFASRARNERAVATA